MASIKPNLYFFGDSFVQWPYPDLHWTERFSDEFNIHRYGSNGASLEHTVFQLGTLPDYSQGDRVVVVLSEIARNPKWMYDDYSEFVDCMGAIRAGKKRKTTPFIESLIKILAIKLDQFDKQEEVHDTPIQIFNLLGRLHSLLSDFKPVYLTWNTETKRLSTLPDDMLTLIPPGSYTTVSEDQGKEAHIDYHPGELGGKVWYDTCKKLLDDWKPIDFVPKKVGSSFFVTKLDLI